MDMAKQTLDLELIRAKLHARLGGRGIDVKKVFVTTIVVNDQGKEVVSSSDSLPMFFLSGFTWPTEALPQLLQYARWLLPSTPAIEASIRFNQIGTSLSQVWYLLAILTLMGVLNFIFLCYIGRIRPNASSVSSTREQ